MNHEGQMGVLAVRQGEYRSYHQISDHGARKGDYVFAVCLVEVPLPPEPRNEKASGLSMVAAFKGGDGKWGWVAVEKDTKTMICEDMEGRGLTTGEWYWLVLSKDKEAFDLRDANVETWKRAFASLGEKRMMQLTMDQKVDEHPDFYDGPCMCKMCQSYCAGD